MKTSKPRQSGPTWAICRKPLRRNEQKTKARSGKDVHAFCLRQATQAGTRTATGAAPGSVTETRTVAGPEPADRSDWDAPQQRRGPGTPSRYPGTCPVCEKPYPRQTLVSKVFAGWAHTACVFPDAARPASRAERDFEANRTAVLSGSTFRGHKASTWRLGGSPSGAGEPRR